MLKNTIVIRNNISEYFSSYIIQNESIFFSRFGGSDTNIIRQYYKNKNLINNSKWYQECSNIVKMYNGYFDFNNDIRNFQKFLEDMIVYYKNTDDSSYCGSYIIDDDDVFFNYVLHGKTIISYEFIESVRPFLKSFTDWGLNKKILIISPFSKSIDYQFKNKDNLYLDYIFPEFELKTYNTKITYNTIGDTKESLGLTTNNWHEECQRIAEDISKIDFDVALLSCASYSMFLGNYIKYNMCKKSIYLGGILNVYSNIYGGRFVTYYKEAGLNPDTRIDPFENSEIEKILGGKDKSTEALNAYFGKRKN